MSSRRRILTERIAIAARVSDAELRDRLALAVASSPDFIWNDDVADVLIADDAWAAQDGETVAVVLLAEADPGRLASRVRALLPPDAKTATILSAARLVAEGLLILPDGEWEGFSAERHETADATPVLTPRETEVLQLLAAGASNKVVARQLDVSVHTVKFHVASLLRKLGADSRLEAVGIGLRTGLLML